MAACAKDALIGPDIKIVASANIIILQSKLTGIVNFPRPHRCTLWLHKPVLVAVADYAFPGDRYQVGSDVTPAPARAP